MRWTNGTASLAKRVLKSPIARQRAGCGRCSRWVASQISRSGRPEGPRPERCPRHGRALSPTEAVERSYHADNCLYVRKHLRSKEANAIMSHGVQLPDLVDCLSPEEAQREFYHELETMRALCLTLLEKERSSGSAGRAAA